MLTKEANPNKILLKNCHILLRQGYANSGNKFTDFSPSLASAWNMLSMQKDATEECSRFVDLY